MTNPPTDRKVSIPRSPASPAGYVRAERCRSRQRSRSGLIPPPPSLLLNPGGGLGGSLISEEGRARSSALEIRLAAQSLQSWGKSPSDSAPTPSPCFCCSQQSISLSSQRVGPYAPPAQDELGPLFCSAGDGCKAPPSTKSFNIRG